MPTASRLRAVGAPDGARRCRASSLGPTTAAPAPSPRRNEIERSVGSTTSESFSAPMTRAYVAAPERISASAWAIAYA